MFFFPLKLTETYTSDVQILYILAGVQLYMSPFRGRACITSSLVDLDLLKKKKERERKKQEASVNITVRREKTLSLILNYLWSYLQRWCLHFPKYFVAWNYFNPTFRNDTRYETGITSVGRSKRKWNWNDWACRLLLGWWRPDLLLWY